MKKVVDTNFIQDEKRLREYLLSSNSNGVILTDYVAMELYNSAHIEPLYRATKVLSEFPRQVAVLKGVEQICGLSGRQSGLQRRMIDERATSQISFFFKKVESACRGDRAMQHWLRRVAEQSAEHLEVVLDGARKSAQAYAGIATLFSADDLRSFRAGATFPKSMARTLVQFTLDLANNIFDQHPTVRRRPSIDEFPNTYIFRAALCNGVLALWWIGAGGAHNTKPERLRNDLVDSYLAAYATYFDGVLSGDNKLHDIYATSKFILSAAFNK